MTGKHLLIAGIFGFTYAVLFQIFMLPSIGHVPHSPASSCVTNCNYVAK